MKNNRFALLVIGCVTLLLATNYHFNILDKFLGENQRSNEALPLNTSLGGVSIFYDALREMGYSVHIDTQNFLQQEPGGIYILTENKQDIDLQLRDAEGWIKSGGQLIYLTANYHLYSYDDVVEKYKEKAYIYSLGEGNLLIGDIDLITNEGLLQDTEGAYFIANWMEELKQDIYFNEYHRFSRGETPSLYRNLPFPIKILLAQVVLLVISCVIYLGKRFGRAERLMEEVEREENEYLHAAANLYEKGKCIDNIYDAFYTKFLKEVKRTFGTTASHHDWVALWQEYGLPFEKKAIKILKDKRPHKTNQEKEMLRAIKDIDQLTEMLIDRREKHWRKLKQRGL